MTWRIYGLVPVPSVSLLVLLGLISLWTAVPRCEAARIASFSECMTPPSNAVNPYFKPLAVDAKFGSAAPYTLSLRIYGNITSGGELKDSYDDARTTLRSTVNVLSYTPFSNYSAFCDDAHPRCPLQPVFADNISDISILPSFSFSHEMQSSYAFSTFTTNFRIKLKDAPRIDAGCIQLSITPYLGMGLSSVLSFIPLGILVMSGIATIVAAIFNPWAGTADVFEWSSNSGRDPDVLRLVTPGFADCLQYIQFVIFSSALSLNYPGFLQPVVSQASWGILMFNMSPVSNAGQSRLIDNVYTPNATYGLESFSQLVGIGAAEDIWAGFMIVFAAILAGVIAGVVIMGFARWALKLAKVFESGDLRNKNIPFLGGMVIRMVYNYMLLPLLSLSAFQLIITKRSPISVCIVAGLVLALFVLCTYVLLRKISSYRPRNALYDELPTLLLYGPLYNTYDEASTLFCVVYILINVLRAVAIGFIQTSGIAQLTLLAICEVIMILTLNAFRPYDPKTSMNLYQTFFSVVRLLAVLFQVAFVPSLGIGDTERGWIGYVILVMHAVVLVFGFFMNAIQTVVEVGARQLGAGGEGQGATRGALAKVFGKHQLSRRTNRRDTVGRPISHASFVNSLGDPHRSGSMVSPNLNQPLVYGNGSAVLLEGGHVQGSGSENGVASEPSPGFGPVLRHTHTGSGSTGYTPGTPGAVSNLSYFGAAATAPAAAAVVNRPGGLGVPGAGPAEYYRPPRHSRAEPPSAFRSRSAGSSDMLSVEPGTPMGGRIMRRHSQVSNLSAGDIGRAYGGDDQSQYNSGLNTRATSMLSDPRRGRTDYYAVREVDQFYRPGDDDQLAEEPSQDQPLSHEPLSEQPVRRLGTGPADPTGPVATVRSWFTGRFGKPKEEKSKGFEVVGRRRPPPPQMTQRSMPPAEGAAAGEGASNPAMDMVDRDRANMEEGAVRTVGGRSTPFDGSDSDSEYSDEEDDGVGTPRPDSRITQLPPVLPRIDAGGDIELNRNVSRRSKRSVRSNAPTVPRKSSRRQRQRPPAPIATGSPAIGAYDPIPSQTPDSVGNQAYDPPVHISNNSFQRLPFTSNSTPSPALGGAPALSGQNRDSVAESFLTPNKRSGTADSDHRPASVGNVQRRLVEDAVRTSDDRYINIGSSAEVVERSNSQGSSAAPSDVSGNVRKRSPSNKDIEPHAK